MEFSIRLVVAILPVLTRFVCLFAPLELIALVMNNENHAYGHERGRNDKDQYATAQGLNHASARRRGLRIAERATLAERWKGEGKHNQSHQRDAKKQMRSLDLHLSSYLEELE